MDDAKRTELNIVITNVNKISGSTFILSSTQKKLLSLNFIFIVNYETLPASNFYKHFKCFGMAYILPTHTPSFRSQVLQLPPLYEYRFSIPSA